MDKDNKLIAEFMGYGAQLHLVEHPETGEYVDPEFHISWDWLMPVVDKIELVQFDTLITIFSVQITCDSCKIIAHPQWDYHMEIYKDEIDIDGENKLDATYKAIIEFINWYNKQDI